MQIENTIRVGMAIMIFKNNKILLGKRKGNHAPDVYALPGGNMEYMESFEECARREVMEETGLKIKNIKFLSLINLKAYAPKHYINIGMIADWESGEAIVLENDKCESWNWYEINNLPSPLFANIELLLESYKSGKVFFDN